jgi:hypothetical protein
MSDPYPKLFAPIVLFILVVVFLLIAYHGEKLPEWLRAFFVFAGLICGVFGILSTANWLAYNVAERVGDYNRAHMLSPEVALADRRLQLVERISNMPADRIATLAAFAMPITEFIGGNLGPIPALRVGEGNVPMFFVAKFWEMSTDEYLVPVRTFASETKERQWAEALTAYLCNFGLALPAAGNNPAKWTSAENAHRWLFGDVG